MLEALVSGGAVVLTRSPQQRARYSQRAKAATSCSIAIKAEIKDVCRVQCFHSGSSTSFLYFCSTDARARCLAATPEEMYLSVACTDVYLCQWHIKLPADLSAWFWLKVQNVAPQKLCLENRLSKNCPTGLRGDRGTSAVVL